MKPHHIQDFYQYLLSFNLTGNTVTRYHANIRKALQYAVKTDLITYNPADKVEKPKKGDYKASFYTDTEMNNLVNLVKGTKIEIPVLLAAYYGLRRSEALGLRFSSID